MMDLIRRVVVGLFAIFLVACGDERRGSNGGGGMGNGNLNTRYEIKDGLVVSNYDEGYNKDVSDWKGFLQCWETQAATMLEADKGVQWRENYIARRRGLAGTASSNAIVDLENKFGHSLPPSFSGFVTAGGMEFIRYRDFRYEGERTFRLWQDMNHLKDDEGFEDFFGNDPDHLNGAVSSHIDGIFRPDLNFPLHGEFVRKATIIGDGALDSELFAVNPRVQTKRGEWEVIWVNSKYHVLRYPSFVDFVLDLYLDDVGGMLRAPIYRAEDVQSGCGSLLRVNGDWRGQMARSH